MDRNISSELDSWLKSEYRPSLILRGARQVGKTWLIRDFAKRHGLTLIELNFERDPSLQKAFSDNDPKAIVNRLSLVLNKTITPDKSILFLDEIQAFGEGLAKLRWFHEEMPELPVMAAGSLLEFTLRDHNFSMPVGRVTFLNVEPLGFDEYLKAHGQDMLLEQIKNWIPEKPIDDTVHEQGLKWQHRFSMVGGMPGIVSRELSEATPEQIRQAQQDLLATYRADFPKYEGRMSALVLDQLLRAVARDLGNKFVYTKVDDSMKNYQAKQALNLLAQARLCHIVHNTSANGIPLGSELKEKTRKVCLLDVGMLHSLLETPALGAFPELKDMTPDMRARVSEQLTNQSIRLLSDNRAEPARLWYWQRGGGRPGEIDHLLQMGHRIIPLELKAGPTGSMKSLHQFMNEKQLSLAVRVDTSPPGLQNVSVKTTHGDPAEYQLINLPHYLLWNLRSIIHNQLDG